ncbi:(2Fe-2S)-binding protein [Pleionea sp. CnH1-48]|uniref:(2Fe-2S)-binding protein n=1 Tax=Pleionea sp. CnH1-48 TaxID=2954494 RepID=UPI00209822D5|nr:(2Fe-2S)-binding protein [Pleionea sp. CnH1-48]MCO7227197.1 (2Fe-2S)-binding protein [Pleionea sp. CnH1-48]
MYVCLCRGVTDSQIKTAVSEGRAGCMRSLNQELGVASQCGKCGKEARSLLKQTLQTVTVTNAA